MSVLEVRQRLFIDKDQETRPESTRWEGGRQEDPGGGLGLKSACSSEGPCGGGSGWLGCGGDSIQRPGEGGKVGPSVIHVCFVTLLSGDRRFGELFRKQSWNWEGLCSTWS